MKSFVMGLLGFCLLIGLAGCAQAPQITPTTVLRLTPEQLPAAPTAARWPTLTPHIFCPGVLESILVVGERGRVTLTDDGKPLNLRAGPGTDFNVIAQLAPLHDFIVLDGARCAGAYAWYLVDYRGMVGWIAESFAGQYYAEPWLTG